MKHPQIICSQGAGPPGRALSVEMLPPPATLRWVARRKAQVVAAVEAGLLTVEEACERYDLSLQEIAAWQISFERAGLAGLRTTKVQLYRTEWERRGC